MLNNLKIRIGPLFREKIWFHTETGHMPGILIADSFEDVQVLDEEGNVLFEGRIEMRPVYDCGYHARATVFVGDDRVTEIIVKSEQLSAANYQ